MQTDIQTQVHTDRQTDIYTDEEKAHKQANGTFSEIRPPTKRPKGKAHGHADADRYKYSHTNTETQTKSLRQKRIHRIS